MCKAIEDMISSRTKELQDRYKALEDMMNDSRAEGIEQGKAELAENLRKIGVPEEQIQKALAL